MVNYAATELSALHGRESKERGQFRCRI